MSKGQRTIDCHVHVAPDGIAKAVADRVRQRFSVLAGGMTLADVLESMRTHGIGKSVIFNTAQTPKHVRTANDFIISVRNEKMIGLGTIHPELDHPEVEVARLRAGGVKGIKFHPLVQQFSANDDRLIPVYKEMGSDMVAYFHCGKNPADLSEPVLNTPAGLAAVKKDFPQLKMVAAHWGGFGMLDEARKHIVGRDIYVDTSWCPGAEILDGSEMAAYAREHINRVVFGTDYPTTTGVQRQIDWVTALELTESERERILWRNATELFSL